MNWRCKECKIKSPCKHYKEHTWCEKYIPKLIPRIIQFFVSIRCLFGGHNIGMFGHCRDCDSYFSSYDARNLK